MFKSISWSEFATAAFYAYSLYYFIVVVVFYGRNFFKRLRISRRWRQSIKLDEGATAHFMGPVRSDPKPNKQTLGSEDLTVSTFPSEEDYRAEQVENLSRNPFLADLLSEVRMVIRVAREEGRVSEILSMITVLLSGYAQVPGPDRDIVNEFIQDEIRSQCSCDLSPHSIAQAWPTEE